MSEQQPQKPLSEGFGVLRSNIFYVKDPDEFQDWFESSVTFGERVSLIRCHDHGFLLAGHSESASAAPHIPPAAVELEPGETPPPFPVEWDLKSFCRQFRKHLRVGSSLNLVSVYHHRLHSVQAERLQVSFNQGRIDTWYEGS